MVMNTIATFVCAAPQRPVSILNMHANRRSRIHLTSGCHVLVLVGIWMTPATLGTHGKKVAGKNVHMDHRWCSCGIPTRRLSVIDSVTAFKTCGFSGMVEATCRSLYALADQVTSIICVHHKDLAHVSHAICRSRILVTHVICKSHTVMIGHSTTIKAIVLVSSFTASCRSRLLSPACIAMHRSHQVNDICVRSTINTTRSKKDSIT